MTMLIHLAGVTCSAIRMDVFLAQESEATTTEIMRAAIEGAPHGVLVVDQNGKIRLANSRLESIFGYSSDELRGQPVDMLVPADRRFPRETSPASEPQELFARRKDGTLIPMEVGLNQTQIGDGTWIVASVVDATPRRAAEEALQHSEAELRTITDNIPAVIARVGNDRRYRFANRQFEKNAGRSLSEIVGKEVREVWGESQYATIEKYIDRALAGEAVTFEFGIPQPGHPPRWLNCSYLPDYGAEGKVEGFYILAQDVTDRKRAEELEASNLALQNFAAIASHDLQSPLRRIIGFAEVLREDPNGLTGVQKKYLERIRDSADRMNTLVEAILDNSRLENHPAMSEVPLQDVLSEVLADLDERVRSIDAKVTADGLPVVWGNRTQIYRLFLNLLSNALKFRSRAPLKIHVGARRDNDAWVFSVADNGIGIEERNRGLIFEMFRRLHGQKEIPGSGIGLSTCQKIVAAHGGRIWVESVYGDGSTFYFTLPLSPPTR